MSTIALFGSSRPIEGDPAYEQARRLGFEIARRGSALLCGGYGGVMEAACRGAREAGGETVGVVLSGRGEPNRWVSRTVEARDLAERLRKLRDGADGWIFLARGLGTMLELVWIAESIVKGETPARSLVLLGPFWKPALDTALREASGPGVEALASCARFAATAEEAVSLVFEGSP